MTRYRSGQVGDVVDQICEELPAVELAMVTLSALGKAVLLTETALRAQGQDRRAGRERLCRDEMA
jgi:hypothetical protein